MGGRRAEEEDEGAVATAITVQSPQVLGSAGRTRVQT